MKCAKCGKELPADAKFCLSCGTPSNVTIAQEGTPVQEEGRRAPAKEETISRTPKSLLAVAGALILVAIIALIFALFLRKPGPQVVRSDITPVKPGPPVTQAPVNPVNPGPAVTQAQTPPPLRVPRKAPPPPEVVEYLKFVKQIEERRVAMRDAQAEYLLKKYVSGNLGKLLADMIGALAEPEGEPEQAIQQAPMQDLKIVASAWENLIRMFDTKQSPPQCRDLAGTYRTALAQYSNAMARLFAAAVQGDIGAAKRVNDIQGDLDKQLSASEQELGRICNEYGIEKDFAITPDQGGGSVLGP